MSTESQNLKLQRFLATGASINPLTAWRKLGIYRLSGRIFDLKQAGWPVKSKMVEVGKGKRVAEYRFDTRKKS